MVSNVKYHFNKETNIMIGELPDGTKFLFDKENYKKIKNINFYRNRNNVDNRYVYIIDAKGNTLHSYLMETRKGYEIDHINLNTLDNRRNNLRLCTHQQNQFNQPLQANNTSGITGVSYYAPRNKYRARIKIAQCDIHLGYYGSFEEAIQARNIGMRCMFGQYGRYNEVDEPPKWLEEKVIEQCLKFSCLAPHSAFFDFWEVGHE